MDNIYQTQYGQYISDSCKSPLDCKSGSTADGLPADNVSFFSPYGESVSAIVPEKSPGPF